MKKFGGPALFLDRNDINTDEIIPAKYLTESTKEALKPYILEDLKLDGFDPRSAAMRNCAVLVTRANFGCGSSREHAVWVLEVNGINVVIAESFARIFRQNMFNCGMMAIELPAADIDLLCSMGDVVEISVDLAQGTLIARCPGAAATRTETFSFAIEQFDRSLVEAGGWLAYADKNY